MKTETAEKTCTVDGCTEPKHAKGMCSPHLMRTKRTGDPQADRPIDKTLHARRAPSGMSELQRLAWFTEPDAEHPACWAWMGGRDDEGYGRVHDHGTTRKAHRWAYELLVGPIPTGHEIDHICEFTSCVNVAHLQALTPEDHKRITRERREARKAMGLDVE